MKAGRGEYTDFEKQQLQQLSETLKSLQIRNGKKITQAEIAKSTGIPQGSISRYLSGKMFPKAEYIEKLATFFNVPDYEIDPRFSSNATADPPTSTTFQRIQKVVDQLKEPRKLNVLTYSEKQLDEQEKEEKDKREVSEPLYLYDVNMVSKAAAASGFGRGFGYDDSDRETVQVDERPPRHDIATRVSGDSMEPDYQDGDILYLTDKGLTTYNGELAVIAYGDRTYFKKIYTEKGRLRLVSLNDKYKDIVLEFPPTEDTHIKIFAVVGSYGKEEGKRAKP